MSARANVAVDFFADLSCPWCYVGWAALKQAAEAESARVAVSVAWRSFLLAPELPPEGVERAAYLSARYSPEQIGAANRVLEQAAHDAGVPLVFGARIPNTLDAHRVVHWAADEGRAEAAIDAIFDACFAEARDISAADVLAACAAQAGMDETAVAAALATERDCDLVLDLHAAAARAGVTGVPVAVFNRKLPLLGAQPVEVYVQALTNAA